MIARGIVTINGIRQANIIPYAPAINASLPASARASLPPPTATNDS